MNQDFWDSIILITSSDTTNYGGEFGTGFVIHQDEHKTYVLTCAHVVSKVGGLDQVKVGGHSAKVEVIGDIYGCDLAVLSVQDELTKLPPLRLGAVAAKGKEFIAAGFYTDSTKTRKLAEICGQLGGMQIIGSTGGDRTPAWNLEISDDSEHELKAGYSGSPVVDKASGYVLGVVAQLTGQGKGLAISIEALGKIWLMNGLMNGLVITKNFSLGEPQIDGDMKEIEIEIERIQKLIDAKVSNRDNLKLSIEYFRGINPVAVFKYEAEVKQLEEEISHLKSNQQKLIQ
jgi:hypothetical protein